MQNFLPSPLNHVLWFTEPETNSREIARVHQCGEMAVDRNHQHQSYEINHMKSISARRVLQSLHARPRAPATGNLPAAGALNYSSHVSHCLTGGAIYTRRLNDDRRSSTTAEQQFWQPQT